MYLHNCITYMRMCLYIVHYTSVILSYTNVHRLWFDEFMALWINCDSYPPWEDVSMRCNNTTIYTYVATLWLVC